MLLGFGAGAVVVVVGAAWVTVHHTRARADSLRRYARAVTALRSIAAEPRPELPVAPPRGDRARPGPPNVRILDDVSPIREARDRRVRASRRARRPDPELLARRPVIATLPSISAAPAGGHERGTPASSTT